ncbi:MAG: ABC transporter substrate-binding protein [Chloroflexota bacterium]
MAGRPKLRNLEVSRREFLAGSAAAALGLGLWSCAPTPQAPQPAPAQPAEQPRYGGELVFAVEAEPPSLDAHRETTFALLHPFAPFYSTLLKFDQNNYPKVVGDLAESWSVSSDGLVYEFKLRDGVKFHDGTPLTSRDVVATYNKIIFPPQGVISARKALYAAVESIEAPDTRTVRFKLKYPSASMLTAGFASPWNWIYKAEIVEKDPRWYEKNVLGTGAFKFVEYVPGSHVLGRKNEDYFIKGRPYLDGFRAVFMTDRSAMVAAIRSGQVLVNFRTVFPTERDDLVRALGDKVAVQESPWIAMLPMVINNERKPFDDPRVRRALTLAIDRWGGSQYLSQFTFLKHVGALMRPGGPFAMPESELEKIPGYWRDINKSREEARRLLREAGIPEGFSFVLKSRNIEPYPTLGIYAIDQWRQIGLRVEHQLLETGPWTQDLRTGNFEAMLYFNCDFMDDPDLQLLSFISPERSPVNYARYRDPVLDDLYDRQSRELDPERRKQLVWEFERRVLGDMAYHMISLWQHRIIVHWAKLKGWKITPSHYINQDLVNVWLAE